MPTFSAIWLICRTPDRRNDYVVFTLKTVMGEVVIDLTIGALGVGGNVVYVLSLSLR